MEGSILLPFRLNSRAKMGHSLFVVTTETNSSLLLSPKKVPRLSMPEQQPAGTLIPIRSNIPVSGDSTPNASLRGKRRTGKRFPKVSNAIIWNTPFTEAKEWTSRKASDTTFFLKNLGKRITPFSIGAILPSKIFPSKRIESTQGFDSQKAVRY